LCRDRRAAERAGQNKSKQKAHELEFRHDRAGGCSNVALLRLHVIAPDFASLLSYPDPAVGGGGTSPIQCPVTKTNLRCADSVGETLDVFAFRDDGARKVARSFFGFSHSS